MPAEVHIRHICQDYELYHYVEYVICDIKKWVVQKVQYQSPTE